MGDPPLDLPQRASAIGRSRVRAKELLQCKTNQEIGRLHGGPASRKDFEMGFLADLIIGADGQSSSIRQCFLADFTAHMLDMGLGEDW